MSSTDQWPSVRINGKAVNRVHSGHPWIFVSDVIDTGSAVAGDVVRVIDAKGRTLGTAHFSDSSQIALRLLSNRAEHVDEQFLVKRLQAALKFRQMVVQDSEAYRLIHAEGDLLPGLIVDRYANYLVVQFLDQGMDRMTEQVVSALSSVVQPAAIIARNDVPTRAKENLPQESKLLFGNLEGPVEFSMNNLRWRADLMGGQKTSAKITKPPPATPMAAHWIVLAEQAVSQCIWQLSAIPSTWWIALPRPCKQQKKTPP